MALGKDVPIWSAGRIAQKFNFCGERAQLDSMMSSMEPTDHLFDRLEIAKNWLPRYTGMPIDEFGDYILLTNFHDYLESFANRFDCEIRGLGRPMQAATNAAGLSIINFGIGSANAATIMDLLIARRPKGVLFLGKCGGLKATTEIGHFILPIAAIRGEGTSADYFPPDVPALPSFKLHKFVSDRIVERDLDYRTGVIYTTNRRLWDGRAGTSGGK